MYVKVFKPPCTPQGSKNSAKSKYYYCRSQPGIVGMTKSDLYQALYPAYHLSKIWGLLPVRFTKENPRRYLGRIYIPDVFYSMSLLILLICCQIWGLWRDLRDGWEFSTRMKSQTAVVVTCSDILAVIILATVSVVGAPFRWNRMQNIMDRLVEVDENLGIVSMKKTRRFAILFILGIFSYLCSLSILDIYTWYENARMTRRMPDKGPINYCPIYFLYAIVAAVEVQYALAAYSLSQRFLRLNSRLQNILRTGTTLEDFRNDSRTGDFNEHGKFRAIIRGETTGAQLFRKRKISNSPVSRKDHQKTADIVAQLVSVHSSLLDTVLLTNSAFGIPVLMVILTCLLHLIVTPYFLIIEANGNKNEMFLVVQFLWCVIHVGRLLVIVQPCHSASVQAKGTAILVSQLLSSHWDPDVRKQMEIFSLQLLHRPLEFSACGLCSLDRSLVTSIAGAVTTYLVILIQFQKADDTKDDATSILKNATQLLLNATTLQNITLLGRS